MKKYLPYSALLILLVVGLVVYAVNSSSRTKVDENIHDEPNEQVVQSHRSYNMELISSDQGMQPGKQVKISYKIVNDEKEIVKDFEVVHDKIMHLIVVRKDLENFQHLHPDFNKQTGEFSINLTFPTDGPYRIFPDFTPSSENPQRLPVTVSYDFNIGDMNKYKAVAAIPDKEVLKKVDGYDINYSFPESIKAQQDINYALIVEKPNEVIQLEPYLGAMGHSVIIIEGSLDFLHTHAEGMDMTGGMEMDHEMPGGSVGFSTSFPEPGIYKLFTQFQVKGKVVTTDYIINVNK